jgi:dTDP-4-dehydrorhamnose reductase
MKLLIAGAAGQLGQALVREAAKQGWDSVATDVGQMDITDPGAVASQLARHRPYVVFIAAAATRVD